MNALNPTARARKRRRARWLDKAADKTRNLPLFLVAFATAAAIEGFASIAAYLIFTAESEIAGFTVKLAHLIAAISIGFGLMSLMLRSAAAAMENDPRPEQRRRAAAARLGSYLMLGPPTALAAMGIGFQGELNRHIAYAGSPAEAADRLTALAPVRPLESETTQILRAEAARRLRHSTRPTEAPFDLGAWITAAFLYVVNVRAVSVGWRAPAETPREAERRERRERRLRAERRRAIRERFEARRDRPGFWARLRAVWAPSPAPAFPLQAWVDGKPN